MTSLPFFIFHQLGAFEFDEVIRLHLRLRHGSSISEYNKAAKAMTHAAPISFPLFCLSCVIVTAVCLRSLVQRYNFFRRRAPAVLEPQPFRRVIFDKLFRQHGHLPGQPGDIFVLIPRIFIIHDLADDDAVTVVFVVNRKNRRIGDRNLRANCAVPAA